jgi:hypothetical protein
MSFIDNAMEAIERTEASLHSLIADALKAKAYGEIATIAAMAQSLAAINAGRAREGKRTDLGLGATAPVAATADTSKGAEPSWMRPKG